MRDLLRYLKLVIQTWLSEYGFVTAMPEIASRLFPERFANIINYSHGFVSAEFQYKIILGLSLLGVFYASFQVWWKIDREVCLRARFTQIQLIDFGFERKINVITKIVNNGPPSVATDWKLHLGGPAIRASVRNFHSDGVQFDPQMKPITQGAHAFGSLMFQTRLEEKEIEIKLPKARLTFQDASRRTLNADDERA